MQAGSGESFGNAGHSNPGVDADAGMARDEQRGRGEVEQVCRRCMMQAFKSGAWGALTGGGFKFQGNQREAGGWRLSVEPS